MNRLASRKLWVAVASILTVWLSETFGIELDPETVVSLAVVASAYILGQAQVDKAKIVEDAANYAQGLEQRLAALTAYLEAIQLQNAEDPAEVDFDTEA